MKIIDLDGYIDDYVFWGDEITPDMLRNHLTANPGDVTFRLNSYGGSCIAAVRMYDMLREHAGNVIVRVSGAACSAASFLMLGADRTEMTPGSQIMIHDPLMVAVGQEKDFLAALDLLRSTKNSILNIFTRKVNLGRDELAQLMTAEKWFDAEDALKAGFIDAITGDEAMPAGPTNAAQPRRPIDRDEAQDKVRAWIERKTSGRQKPADAAPEPPPISAGENPIDTPAPPTTEQQPDAGVFVGHRMKLLELQEG